MARSIKKGPFVDEHLMKKVETISSVTYTGTCLRPSYTAKVCPMKLGKIVERRDHVLHNKKGGAQMARSIKKGPFVDEHLMKKVEAQEGSENL
jgi:ribosomal protein S19